MDGIAKWSNSERAELFAESAAQLGMTPAVVEKDFWVCWALGKLFQSDVLSRKILFKGGTSLSKVFNLIERFSEDIDLVLDWKVVTTENPLEERTRTQQDRFNKELTEATQEYVRKTFLPEVRRLTAGICDARISKDSSHVIEITYPSMFRETYLRSLICLEIGPLASWLPNSVYGITSYAAEQFPKKFLAGSCKVNAIRAERTFWEKATILHAEAHRPAKSPQPSRYSRHYYDLARMADAKVRSEALSDLELLHDVVTFKDKFYHQAWAGYDLAYPGTFRLSPPKHLLNTLRKDYQDMKIMIFGEALSFEEILVKIAELEGEINALE